jgi:hypothetical protein
MLVDGLRSSTVNSAKSTVTEAHDCFPLSSCEPRSRRERLSFKFSSSLASKDLTNVFREYKIELMRHGYLHWALHGFGYFKERRVRSDFPTIIERVTTMTIAEDRAWCFKRDQGLSLHQREKIKDSILLFSTSVQGGYCWLMRKKHSTANFMY